MIKRALHHANQVATTAANLTAAQIISASTLAMAKSATMFMGAHLFQGLATGNFKVDMRGLGVTMASALLLGSGPNLDAKATFMDNLASQVVHELKAAPTRMAINTTIGGERFEDAAISTLRQGTSHAIGATLAHQLGQLYQGPDKLGYFTHKLAHFASGALTGTIMANDPLGGAFGAAFAEVAMEAMVDAEKEAKAIYKENPTLSIPEVEALMKERIMLRRYFSQVIGGFVGTVAGDGNFGVAASISAIALDYNMEPTLTSAATAAYLLQQAPVLEAFLISPQGMVVAASLGIVALSIDQIKENLELLGQLYQVYVMVLRDEIGIDTAGGLFNTKSGDQVNQSTLFNTQSSSSAAGGMPDPDDDKHQRQWNPQKNHDKKAMHGRFGNFYRDSVTKEWWTKDTAGHGGSSWKVYKETGNGLQWKYDANSLGQAIVGKNRGPIGREIPWKELIMKR